LVSEFIKWIPPIPTEDDKLADRVVRCNPKVYDGKYDPVELEEWIGGMHKSFTVVEVPDEKRVNIVTFHLTEEVDI